MTTAMLERVPVQRRSELFHEISRLILEAGAIDRALEHTDEGWCVDDTLDEIVTRIEEELKYARKSRRLAKILKMEDARSIA